jgi:hypothetical protein
MATPRYPGNAKATMPGEAPANAIKPASFPEFLLTRRLASFDLMQSLSRWQAVHPAVPKNEPPVGRSAPPNRQLHHAPELTGEFPNWQGVIANRLL